MHIVGFCLLLLALTAVSPFSGAGAAPAAPGAEARAEQAMIELIEAAPMRDVAVIIGSPEGRLFSYEKGKARLSAPYRSASAAKLLSALTLYRLVEDGTLSLSDSPQRYLPYWTDAPSDPRSQVTLEQLLSFTSGFNARPGARGCIRRKETTLAACARRFYEEGLSTSPGEAFSYGPAHLQIAAAMAEAATGKPFRQLFLDTLIRPQGLSAATDFVSPSGRNPRASGGAVVTGEDYERLLRALLAGDLIEDIDRFIAPRTLGAVTAYSPAAGAAPGWAYALGAWTECDAPAFTRNCAEAVTLSSPGAFGFVPWIDFGHGYYGLILMEKLIVGFRPAALAAVELEQSLQPLAEDLVEFHKDRAMRPERHDARE
ncbi:hypothetical protein PB2503_13309 [Parvularcula bermudensis HTCC2503]|uniref:Beta-lactamase-related domain-containing protein n=1 Tax=Parvularcula bermudensis (strain ATCC BAA-594 / HTCC2503 / KCTC 12087) TaxID=314260 RepID=E0TGU0_PARBH|nr:serine hydrolase domain-containing protein [Parvularcula bermudensis]ADM10699.1 hypothetical protein PB2503_13309 [Parvularcula bermudensis HTCC2503]